MSLQTELLRHKTIVALVRLTGSKPIDIIYTKSLSYTYREKRKIVKSFQLKKRKYGKRFFLSLTKT